MIFPLLHSDLIPEELLHLDIVIHFVWRFQRQFDLMARSDKKSVKCIFEDVKYFDVYF